MERNLPRLESCHFPRQETRHWRSLECLLVPKGSSLVTWNLLASLQPQRTYQFLHL